MAYEFPVFCQSLPAGADLRTKQFYFVKLNTSGQVVAIAADTDVPIGVLQNEPNTGEAAIVMRLGVSKIVGGADLSIGNQIGTSATGKAVARAVGTDTTKYVVGICELDNTADGGIISASVNCLAPHRAA